MRPMVFQLLGLLALTVAAPAQGSIQFAFRHAQTASARIMAQEPDPAAPDARAVALLQRAIRAQCGAERPPELTSYEGHCQFKLFEYDDDASTAPRTISGDIAQYWATSKKAGSDHEEFSYRRELETDHADKRLILVIEGDDGFCWKLDGTKHVPLNQVADERDREKLAAERGRVRQLFRLFFLGNLDYEPASVRAPEPETVEFKIGTRRFVHEQASVLSLRDRGGNDVVLWLDADSDHVVRARVRRPGHDVVEQFDMAWHVAVPVAGTEVTVNIPWWVRYVENGRPVLEVTASSTTERPEPFRLNAMTKKDRRRLLVFPDE